MDIQLQKSLETPSNVAILSSGDGYTIFRFGDYILRFKAPYSLEYYHSVKEWDNGYIVVMAKYKHNNELEEDYIDLIPILQNLHIDAESFLKPIKYVEIKYFLS